MPRRKKLTGERIVQSVDGDALKACFNAGKRRDVQRDLIWAVLEAHHATIMNAYMAGYDVRYIWESVKRCSELKCGYPNFCHVFRNYAETKEIVRRSVRKSAAKPHAARPRFSPPVPIASPARPPIPVPVGKKAGVKPASESQEKGRPKRDFSAFGKPSIDQQLKPSDK